MELHYQAKVDDEECNVVSVEVDGLEKLRDVKRALIDENEWGETANNQSIAFVMGNECCVMTAVSSFA